jgi:nicotinate-nucleotide adenylyltransferase
VGLLGGSFDPVHYGHLRAAEAALEAFDLRSVWLVPARQSPFKGPCVESAQHRLALLNLAALDNPRLGVEDCELNRDAPSYTVDTLRTLEQRLPDTRFVLILGSDAAASLDKWRDIAEVKRMAEVRILRRPGGAATAPSPNELAFDGLAVSSTDLRGAIRANRSIRYLTPESVRIYIEEKGLYK